jgi:hypothetical protein
MPKGTRHRVSGWLRRSERGLILQVDGGGVWALDAGNEALKFIDLRVTVEGVRSGFDRLDVDWIGGANAAR